MSVLPSCALSTFAKNYQEMLWKALLVWLIFMVCAILNGTLRVKFIVPFVGEPVGHVISTVLLGMIILGITWCFIPWLGADTVGQAIGIGIAWLLLTLVFEFGVGHYISYRTWPELLADYDILHGRVWVLIPITTFVAPWWMAVLRGMLP